MKPKIETGIPLPETFQPYRIMDDMKVGQSILFGKGTQPNVRFAARLRFGKAGYAVRTIKEGVRVWRLK